MFSVEIKCPKLRPPSDGQISCTDESFYLSQCITTCDKSHELKGENTTECQADRTWTEDVPTCRSEYADTGTRVILDTATELPIASAALTYNPVLSFLQSKSALCLVCKYNMGLINALTEWITVQSVTFNVMLAMYLPQMMTGNKTRVLRCWKIPTKLRWNAVLYGAYPLLNASRMNVCRQAASSERWVNIFERVLLLYQFCKEWFRSKTLTFLTSILFLLSERKEWEYPMFKRRQIWIGLWTFVRRRLRSHGWTISNAMYRR